MTIKDNRKGYFIVRIYFIFWKTKNNRQFPRFQGSILLDVGLESSIRLAATPLNVTH